MSNERDNIESLLRGAGAAPESDDAFRAALWDRLSQEQVRLTTRPRGRWIRFAAAAVLLAGIGLAFHLMERTAPVREGVVVRESKRLPGEIVALLSDPESDLRLYAVGMVGRYGSGEHVNDVARVVLDDEDPAVRRAARTALHQVWEREESSLDDRRTP